MYNPEGGFYSAQDADSEGEEGKYYVWELDEVKNLLGNDAKPFIQYYGLTQKGNFEHGKNILHISQSIENIEKKWDIDKSRAILLEERKKRVHPGLDDKILTSWSALMISSMAYGYQILRKEAYLNAATKSAEFILNKVSKDGMLLRTYRNNRGKLNAYSEDYGFMIGALIDLYETDSQIKWLQEAIRLNNVLIDEFWDNQNGGFFYTGNNHEKLVIRPKSAYDSVIPSGNSSAAMNLLRLNGLTGDRNLSRMAGIIFRLFMDQIKQTPTGFPQMLCALDFYLEEAKEIVVIGKKNDPKTQEMLRIIYEQYIPNKVLAIYDPYEDTYKINNLEDFIPLLKGRINAGNEPTAYICQNHTCKTPIKSVEALKEALLDKKS